MEDMEIYIPKEVTIRLESVSELPTSESNTSVNSTTELNPLGSSNELVSSSDTILQQPKSSESLGYVPTSHSFKDVFHYAFPLGREEEFNLFKKAAYLLAKMHLFSFMCLIACGTYL